jgi:TRAP-type C4-dicarboxylate transport system permease small subunit
VGDPGATGDEWLLARLRRVADFPIEDVLGVVITFAILVTMSTQIFLRYVLNDSLIWSDELSRYLLIAMAFIGCATGVRKRCHIRIDAIDLFLPPRARHALALVVDGCVLFYLGYIVYASLGILQIFARQPSTALGVSMAVPYSVITIGFGLAALRMVLHYVPRPRE